MKRPPMAVLCVGLAACTSQPSGAQKESSPGAASAEGASDGVAAVDQADALPPGFEAEVDEPEVEPPPPVEGARFWVKGWSTLYAIDLDGESRYSRETPAGVGRVIRRAQGDFIGIVPGPPAQMVVFGGGKIRRTLIPSVIPSEGCEPRVAKNEGEDHGPAQGPFGVHASEDFRLAEGGARACARLLDNYARIAKFGVDTQLDLTTTQVEAVVAMDQRGECPDPGVKLCSDAEPLQPWVEVEKGGPWEGWKEHDPKVAASQGDWGFSYDQQTGYVTNKKGRKKERLCIKPPDRTVDLKLDCLGIDAVSSSKRWLLLHGPIEQTVVADRALYLFDRKTAELANIVVPDKGDDPFGVMPVQPSVALSAENETIIVDRDSDVASLPGDLFWLDGWLLLPAQSDLIGMGGTRVLTPAPTPSPNSQPQP